MEKNWKGIESYLVKAKESLKEKLDRQVNDLVYFEGEKKGEKISGLTPMQRFFLGYALGWLGQTRQEQLRSRLLTDPHAPGKYRVNGPFVDVDEFYTTFNIKPASPMYRPDSLRVRIW